jgi:type I restriction enzyme S subunit
LSELATFTSGGTPSRSKSEYFGGEIPWITGADIDLNGQVKARSFVTPEAIAGSAASVVPAGTAVLVTRTSVGKVGVVAESTSFSQDITAIHHDSSLLDRAYLLHFLRSQRQYFMSQARGATIQGVTREVVSNIRVPVLPLDEQRRIAAIFDEVNRTLCLMRLQFNATDELASSFAADLFESTTRRERLADIAQRVTVGHVGPTAEYVTSEGTPLLRTQNIGRGVVVRTGLIHIHEDLAGRLSKSRLRTGDVLISRHVVDEIRCAVLPSDLDGANCANMVLVSPSSELRGEVLSHFLRSSAAQDSLLGRRVGSAQKVVNTGVLQQLLVPVPERAAQERFCSAVRVLDRQAALMARAAAETESLLVALERRLFYTESAVGTKAK